MARIYKEDLLPDIATVIWGQRHDVARRSPDGKTAHHKTLDGRYARATWRIPTGTPSALTLADLHPAIHQAAGQLYVDGHYADAIGAAVKTLEVAVRARSGLAAAPNLMGQAFSDEGPLDIRHHDGRTGIDEQEGFRFLFMGAARALRNPRAHEFIDDDPVSALEQLALMSLLHRRLDSSRKKRRRGSATTDKSSAPH